MAILVKVGKKGNLNFSRNADNRRGINLQQRLKREGGNHDEEEGDYQEVERGGIVGG